MVYPFNLSQPPSGFFYCCRHQPPSGCCEVQNGHIKCILKVFRRKEPIRQLSVSWALHDPQRACSLGRFRICNRILLFEMDVAFFKWKYLLDSKRVNCSLWTLQPWVLLDGLLSQPFLPTCYCLPGCGACHIAHFVPLRIGRTCKTILLFWCFSDWDPFH